MRVFLVSVLCVLAAFAWGSTPRSSPMPTAHPSARPVRWHSARSPIASGSWIRAPQSRYRKLVELDEGDDREARRRALEALQAPCRRLGSFEEMVAEQKRAIERIGPAADARNLFLESLYSRISLAWLRVRCLNHDERLGPDTRQGRRDCLFHGHCGYLDPEAFAEILFPGWVAHEVFAYQLSIQAHLDRRRFDVFGVP